jgi:hypothetical protein
MRQKKDQPLEPPFKLDMAFGEALVRYALTRPEEVAPAPGRSPKASRPGRDSKGRRG